MSRLTAAHCVHLARLHLASADDPTLDSTERSYHLAAASALTVSAWVALP